jgi:hypothetical protein
VLGLDEGDDDPLLQATASGSDLKALFFLGSEAPS